MKLKRLGRLGIVVHAFHLRDVDLYESSLVYKTGSKPARNNIMRSFFKKQQQANKQTRTNRKAKSKVERRREKLVR